MNTLTSLNLYYTGDYAYDDNVPQGQVISQSPEEGTEVDKNSRVNFIISNGKEPQPQEQVTTYTYTVTDNVNNSNTTSGLPSLENMSFEDFVIGKWYAHYLNEFDKTTKYYSKDEFVIEFYSDNTFEMWNKDGEYCNGKYKIYKETTSNGITLYALYLLDAFDSDKYSKLGYNPWGDIHAQDNYKLCAWHNDGGFTRTILERYY